MDTTRRGTLVVYGEEITLRSGRHVVGLHKRPVTFNAKKDKPFPRGWIPDPPHNLAQLAKRPGVTCTYRTRPAVLTISGITRADVEEIKDTLINTGPDLAAVELEFYLRTQTEELSCKDVNLFMWRFYEDDNEDGDGEREGADEDNHNSSVCSSSSATSGSSGTGADDTRSTILATDSSGIGYSSTGHSSSGPSSGGVPSPDRQEPYLVVGHTSKGAPSTGQSTPTDDDDDEDEKAEEHEEEEGTPPAGPSAPTATHEEKPAKDADISSHSNSNSTARQEAKHSSSGASKGDKGDKGDKDSRGQQGPHVDGGVSVEVVPVDVRQLNGHLKLRDDEENFRIVARAIRRALVWLGYTESVLFVATGPGAPFKADTLPAHMRAAVLGAISKVSGGGTDERRATAQGEGEQHGSTSSVGVQCSGDDSDGSDGDGSSSSDSTGHGYSEAESGVGGEEPARVCASQAVFVLAATDEGTLRHVRAKVDDALTAFRLNVPPHWAEAPSYLYLHTAKHEIEEHDDSEHVAEGRGLVICRKPLTLPEPWPKAMESVEMLILLGAKRLTLKEWRGLMTNLPNLRLLVCHRWNTEEVQEAALANAEERDLFLRTAVWSCFTGRKLKESKFFADGDVVAFRRALLLLTLGKAMYDAGTLVGHIPHYREELPDGILAYGKTEDMVWGSKDHEQLEECPGCVPHSSWQRCPRCELYEYDELYERDAPFLRDMAAES